MENVTKQQIVEQLRKEVDKSSQNKMAFKLGISNATVSHLLSGKWDKISDDLFRTVEKQLGVGVAAAVDWIFVETDEAETLQWYLDDARENSNVFGICADAGYGKTEIGTKRIAPEKNDFAVCCHEYFNRKTFLAELLTQMGKDPGGYTVAEMIGSVINTVNKLEKPSIRLDEADKLSDQVLYFFISLYNLLEGKCGIVMMATDHLKKRIKKGVDNNRKGFKEIYSRLGRRFIELPRYSNASIKKIIRANGVIDAIAVSAICNDAEGDIRRVKRLVHAYRVDPTMYDKIKAA